MSFSKNDLETIKSKIKLSSEIGKKTKIIKKGNDHWCCCPFHDEKTPSCKINDDLGSFYCFGCGAKGDIFTIYTDLYNFSFPDAVKELGQRIGIKITDNNFKLDKKSEKYFEILECATDWFEKNLQLNDDCIKYLKKRSISNQTISDFRIGYSDNPKFKISYVEDKKSIPANPSSETGIEWYHDYNVSNIHTDITDPTVKSVFNSYLCSSPQKAKAGKKKNAKKGKAPSASRAQKTKRDFSTSEARPASRGSQLDAALNNTSGGGDSQGIYPKLLTQETLIGTEQKNINSKNIELAEKIKSLKKITNNYNTDLGPHFGDGIASFKNGIVQPIIIVKTSTKCYIIKADSTDKVTGDTYKNIPEATHRNGPYFTCKGNSNRQKSNVGVMMKHGDTMVFSVTRLKNDPCWARIVSRSFRILYLLTDVFNERRVK